MKKWDSSQTMALLAQAAQAVRAAQVAQSRIRTMKVPIHEG